MLNFPDIFVTWFRIFLNFDFRFSHHPFGRMILRADRLKSNYLGCWIFEISSAPDLDPFSILFFVFLNIRSVEFDKFHLVFAFWVAWGLGTLRLTRLWIYIWVFVELGVKISVKKMKIFMKKWSFPNRSRINLGWSLDHQGMKKHQFGSIGSFRNHEKHQKISKNDKLKNWPRKWTDKHVRSYSRSFSPFYGGSGKKKKSLKSVHWMRRTGWNKISYKLVLCNAALCCAVLG